jgi:hypothetical protein
MEQGWGGGNRGGKLNACCSPHALERYRHVFLRLNNGFRTGNGLWLGNGACEVLMLQKKSIYIGFEAKYLFEIV